METIIYDLRGSLRILVKNPAFTIIAVIALAIGIGANSTIFSLVNAVLLRPLPYPDSHRLVVLDEYSYKNPGSIGGVSFPNVLDWREQNKVFAGIAMYQTISLSLNEGDRPEELSGSEASYNLFDVLGVNPVLGRMFSVEEDQPNGNRVVIIGHGLWQRRFGSDPAIVGKAITLQGRPWTVVGVMPVDFKFPEVAEFWIPLRLDTTQYTRNDHGLSCIARLKPGVDLQQAKAEMSVLAKRIEEANPVTNEGLSVSVTDLRDNLSTDTRKILYILMGAVLFVLLIACANVANLLLARAASRQKEMAIRAALGAERSRIIKQLLTESLVLGIISGLCGLALSRLGIDLLLRSIPNEMPFWMKFSLDYRILIFTTIVSFLTGIVFGLAPALQISKPNLSEALKDSGRGTSSSRSHRLLKALVVSEVALSLVLLVGAGLMVKSFLRLQHVNPGFNPGNVLAFQISLPGAKYNAEKRKFFYNQLLEKLQHMPGVISVGGVSALPMNGGWWGRSLTVEGFPVLSVGQAPILLHQISLPGYFKTMGITLLAGREFTESDGTNGEQLTIINQAIAKRYFPNGDALGKRIRFGPPEDNEPWHTIIGVAGDVKQTGLDDHGGFCAYLPFNERTNSTMDIVVRTSSSPEGLAQTTQTIVKDLDSTLPIIGLRSMDEIVSRSMWQQRLYSRLFALFGIVALVLAAVGIYGVMSYTVSQRTHEIGIRMALGAQAFDVLKSVLREGLLQTIIGLVIGLAASLALTRLMESVLFEVKTTDVMTFTVVSALLAIIALAACFIPARKASKVDPLVAMRID